VLAERVHAVGQAWRQGDEAAAREQLQVLAAEATLLSRMAPAAAASALNARSGSAPSATGREAA